MYGQDFVEEVLVSEEEIKEKCAELGKKITEDYRDVADKTVLVALLKGAVPFMAELIKHIELPIKIDFMDVTSYSGTESMGDIKIIKDLDSSVKGMHVLLVEDIVDTGLTITHVKKMFYNKGADDVKVVCLLDKPDRRTVDVEAEYVGFTIPNKFVIGFGLDFNQDYRNLPFVGVLKPEYYE